MGNIRSSRHGSMQFWPRKRAKSELPRLRSRVFFDGVLPDGFCGYKVGMTHLIIKDTRSHSLTKNQTIVRPATIIECPPLKVAGVRFYKKENDCTYPFSEIFTDKVDKELARSLSLPKPKEFPSEGYDDVRLIVYTQPKTTSIGKKAPEVFEMALSGSLDEKVAYAKDKLGKEITVNEVLKEHELVDVHGVTIGKGTQGPVKRFGVAIRSHKSEKTKRGPGSLGPWCGQQHVMYRVAHAGQTGFHQRVERNKAIISIADDASKINPKGGFVRYGEVKNPYILVMGSVPGPEKRVLRLTPAARPNSKKKTNALQIIGISTESKQR